jgi:hypothetical protein
VALAVCLLFDRRSERAVRALWDRVEEQGVVSLRSHTHGRHVPHVSYAVLRQWDQAAVADALAAIGGGEPVELSFEGVGLFRRGRTWLVAGVSADFVARQQRVVEAITATGACIGQQRDRTGQPAGGVAVTATAGRTSAIYEEFAHARATKSLADFVG